MKRAFDPRPSGATRLPRCRQTLAYARNRPSPSRTMRIGIPVSLSDQYVPGSGSALERPMHKGVFRKRTSCSCAESCRHVKSDIGTRMMPPASAVVPLAICSFMTPRTRSRSDLSIIRGSLLRRVKQITHCSRLAPIGLEDNGTTGKPARYDHSRLRVRALAGCGRKGAVRRKRNESMNLRGGRSPRRAAPVKAVCRSGTRYAAPMAAWNPDHAAGERRRPALEAARRPHAGAPETGRRG